MARNRPAALKRQIVELRGRYQRTRKWLNFAINDMDSIWRAEAGNINQLDPAAQLVQLERLTAHAEVFRSTAD
jgi:hypothetical protein